MIKQNKNLIPGVFLGIFILVASGVNLNAYIMANYSGAGFNIPGDKGMGTEIEAIVIESAESFLKSYSDFLIFLSKIERSALDRIEYDELTNVIDASILEMERARDIYFDLTKRAEMTPYKKNVIKKLKNFDYSAYLQEESLHTIIFNEVRDLLSKGDVRGLYNQLLLKVENILTCLNKVRMELNKTRLPEISGLWELNGMFSGTLIFGQYTAMIFAKILTDK